MKILLIEDEKKISNFIKKGLEEENYLVDTAFNGKDGFEIAVSAPYDLIIMDLMLPYINGFDLCKKLRESGVNTPILMLTVRDSVEDKVKGLDSGADDYLTKPFAFEELLARIRALLRKRNIVEKTILKIDDLEMDLISHKVKRGGKEIILTSKEYALLEYLLRNKGKIVTRTMIYQNVWDIGFDTETNVIDVFVNYLRKKIDGNGSKKLIHTIRGKGYMLQEEDAFGNR
ncbi:MAG: heavy metal response regulator transcription factor [Elusimicrobiales bacterium]|nr:response regulator transcription factor [Elusimicrobiales bacterium]HOJ85776.1 response regulator transcription factor [Elusimicrobiales bacterium]HOL63556.1 response regulator transcription factor [Elusimicrobiales bacterium]HPO94533.1 response regulator transcription factor [Elusimicrobiales bacterium]